MKKKPIKKETVKKEVAKEREVVKEIVKKQEDIKEAFSIVETNGLIQQGYVVIEVRSAIIGVRPKTWMLRKEN
jgi:hypothetical protein